jgi:uncharacterized protein YbaR (Trm112 family)
MIHLGMVHVLAASAVLALSFHLFAAVRLWGGNRGGLVLACPIDKEALLYFPDDGVLYNPRLRRSYPIEAGIPVLLADHSTIASAERHGTLLARGDALATLGRDPAELLKELDAD